MIEEKLKRRSNRIELKLKIQVIGNDTAGKQFIDDARTLVISRYGAMIVLGRGLAPEDEIGVRCLETTKEAAARVIGQAGASPEGHLYGIELLDPSINPWGIAFPPVDEAELAAGRLLLECLSCHTRELVLLNDLELQVFQSSFRITRNCHRCNASTIWGEPLHENPQKELASIPANGQSAIQPPPNPHPLEVGGRTRNDRTSPRINAKVSCCVRTPAYGDDPGTTDDLSRGGFRFTSRKKYSVGSLVEASVPYTKGGANIFVVARIAWSRDLPDVGTVAYGIAYARGFKEKVQQKA
jgi:PilZ domain-containing protein